MHAFYCEIINGNKEVDKSDLMFYCYPMQALRMILQLGVKPSWFDLGFTDTDVIHSHIPETGPASPGDLRSYMIESTLPAIGDSVVPELLLKVLEPYRREGMLLCLDVNGFCILLLPHVLNSIFHSYGQRLHT